MTPRRPAGASAGEVVVQLLAAGAAAWLAAPEAVRTAWMMRVLRMVANVAGELGWALVQVQALAQEHYERRCA